MKYPILGPVLKGLLRHALKFSFIFALKGFNIAYKVVPFADEVPLPAVNLAVMGFHTRRPVRVLGKKP